MKFKHLKPGDFLEAYALVQDFRIRYTVNQTPYYGLLISDGETTLDARLWDINLKKDLASGVVYKMSLKINDFGGKIQAVINNIQDVEEGEIDINEFYRFAPLERTVLEEKIKEYIKSIQNENLKTLVKKVIDNVYEDFFTFPGGVSMHHNYLSGLAYHTYSMLCLADQFISNYPSINKDLLYAGVLVHDIGKTKEFSDAKQPQYTKEGNLLGHLIIGLNMLTVEAEKLNILEIEEVQSLLHLVIAHHGELQYGSAKEPLMMEAVALYLIDLTDSRMGAIEDEVAKTEKGTWTNPISALGKKPLYVVSDKNETKEN